MASVLAFPDTSRADTPMCLVVGMGGGAGDTDARRMRNFVAGALSAIDDVFVADPTTALACPAFATMSVRVDWELVRVNGTQRSVRVAVWDPAGHQRYATLNGVIESTTSQRELGMAVAIEVSMLVERDRAAIARAYRAAPPAPPPPPLPRDRPRFVEPLPPAMGEPDVHLLDP